MPDKARQEDILRKLDELEQRLQDARPDLVQEPAPARPLPELQAATPPSVAETPSTLRGNLVQASRELGASAVNTLQLAPLGLVPMGTAVLTGQALGDLSAIGMRLFEREQGRRLGTPRQRAEKAYGQGIEARIKRNQSKRRFR